MELYELRSLDRQQIHQGESVKAGGCSNSSRRLMPCCNGLLCLMRTAAAGAHRDCTSALHGHLLVSVGTKRLSPLPRREQLFGIFVLAHEVTQVHFSTYMLSLSLLCQSPAGYIQQRYGSLGNFTGVQNIRSCLFNIPHIGALVKLLPSFLLFLLCTIRKNIYHARRTETRQWSAELKL